MSDRLRLAFITSALPHPLNSGYAIRAANVARALCSVGDVHLISLADEGQIAALSALQPAMPEWMNAFASVELRPWAGWQALDALWYRRVSGWRPFARTPLLHSTFPTAQQAQALVRLGPGVDLVWCSRLFVAEGLQAWRRKVIVDIDDLESVKLQRSIAAGMHGRPSTGLLRELRLLQRAERAAASRFGAAVVCSPGDAARLGGESDSLWCVPNGVADEHFDRPPAPFAPHRIVFVGALSYEPNASGIVEFCRQVLPAIRQRRPDVVLDIVGRSPPPQVTALQDGKHVFVHADVPDVVPFVQGAAVSIVPLRVGGGTRLKILESLALSTPVVSTAVGAEGIDLTPGVHALIVDDLPAMGEAIIAVLDDSDLRARIAQAGREKVRRQYGWAAIRGHIARSVAKRAETLNGWDRHAT